MKRSGSAATLASRPLTDIETPLWLRFKILPNSLYVAVIGGYLFGMLNASILWCFLLLACIHSFVYGEIETLKRNLIFSAQRENATYLLSHHSETVEWLNHILSRFWNVYYAALSEDLHRNIDLVLDSACPSFLDSLKLKVFSLGSTPPVFSNAQVYPSLEPDLISLDLDFGFEPLPQEDSYISSGIIIELVASLLKVELPIRMRLKLKLINNYPYVKTTEFCFLSSPELKFTLKPLLPINVMDIPLLQEFIANLVKSSLAWYIAPNTYSVDVEEMMKVDKTDKVAIGIVKITIKQARDLPNAETFGSLINKNNLSDPFVKLYFDDHASSPVAQTRVIDNNLSPIWNEIFYVPVPPRSENFLLYVYHKSGLGEQFIGKVSDPIHFNDEKLDKWVDLYNKSNEKKTKGQLRYQCQFFPRIDIGVLEVIEATGSEDRLDIFKSGVMHINIIEAKELSLFPGIYPQLMVYIDGKKKYTTSTKKLTSKPYWNEIFEFFTEDCEAISMEFIIIDAREKMKLASWAVMGSDIKDLAAQESEWHELIPVKNPKEGFRSKILPRLRFNLCFFPVDFRKGNSDTLPRIPATLEVRLLRASGLLAVNNDGKTSDPYFCIEINNKRIFKTSEYQKQLNPILNKEPVIGILLSLEDLDCLQIFIRDHNAFGKMRPMGSVYYDLSSLVLRANDFTSKCSELYLPIKTDVIFEGSPQGILEFEVRLRILNGGTDQILRRKKEGNIISLDASYGLDAAELFILNENPTKARNITIFDSSPRIGPSKAGTIRDFFSSKTKTYNSLNLGEEDKSETGILEIELVKATSLLGINSDNGLSDPYVTIYYKDSQIFKSNTYFGNLNPDFSKEKKISIPITLQMMVSQDVLTFKVKDYNKITQNKFIGQLNFSLVTLIDFERNKADSGVKGPIFKSPDGVECVLIDEKPFNGTMNLTRDDKVTGQLTFKCSLKLKRKEEQIKENMDIDQKSHMSTFSSLTALPANVEVKIELKNQDLIKAKEKEHYFIQVVGQDGEILWKSPDSLTEKRNFTHLFPMAFSFPVINSPREAKVNVTLKICYGNPIKILEDFPFSFDMAVDAKLELNLRDCLKAQISISKWESSSELSVLDVAKKPRKKIFKFSSLGRSRIRTN